MSRNIVMACVLGVLLAAGAAFAEKPVRTVSPRTHPYISAAQKYVYQAYNNITDALLANEFDMEGHAQKAKDLLEQVHIELIAAAEATHKYVGIATPDSVAPIANTSRPSAEMSKF